MIEDNRQAVVSSSGGSRKTEDHIDVEVGGHSEVQVGGHSEVQAGGHSEVQVGGSMSWDVFGQDRVGQKNIAHQLIYRSLTEMSTRPS